MSVLYVVLLIGGLLFTHWPFSRRALKTVVWHTLLSWACYGALAILIFDWLNMAWYWYVVAAVCVAAALFHVHRLIYLWLRVRRVGWQAALRPMVIAAYTKKKHSWSEAGVDDVYRWTGVFGTEITQLPEFQDTIKEIVADLRRYHPVQLWVSNNY